MMSAETLLNEAYDRYKRNWVFVYALRSIADAGLPRATNPLMNDNVGLIEYIDGPIRSTCPLFQDATPISPEFRTKLAQEMTRFMLDSGSAALDAAILLFAHSILDDCAFSLCQVCSKANPADWEALVINKHVQLAAFKGKGFEDVRNELIEEKLKAIERASLPEKIAMLYRLCAPPKDFTPLRGYSYDATRLEQIDSDRHKIVHHSGFTVKRSNLSDDLKFIFSTVDYLLALVSHRHHLLLR